MNLKKNKKINLLTLNFYFFYFFPLYFPKYSHRFYLVGKKYERKKIEKKNRKKKIKKKNI